MARPVKKSALFHPAGRIGVEIWIHRTKNAIYAMLSMRIEEAYEPIVNRHFVVVNEGNQFTVGLF
jgi:hypothetical protein